MDAAAPASSDATSLFRNAPNQGIREDMVAVSALPPRAAAYETGLRALRGPEGECSSMATYMIKVAGEGLVAKAHKLADPGPTTGSSIVYEVTDVPDGFGVDDVIARFRQFAAPSDRYEISFRELPEGAGLTASA